MKMSAVALVFRDAGIQSVDGRGVILPGGKCEAGETFRECAIRELREEVGLRAVKSRLIYHGPTGVDDWYTFCEADGQFRGSEEGAAVLASWDDLMSSAYRAYYDILREIIGGDS